MNRLFTLLLLLSCLTASTQENEDSLDNQRLAKMVNLTEVIIRSDLNVARFINQVKNDTTFYKAFRNLHIIGFTSWNDIRIRDKKGSVQAALMSKTRQVRANGCRTMELLSETSTGDFYDDQQQYNYYTAELYAGLFFTKGTVCGKKIL